MSPRQPLFSILLLLLAVSSSFSQELTFLRLPFTSLTSSSSSSSLPVDQVDALIANILGVPTALSWPGLRSASSLERAKANLLFVVEGLSTPEALHLQRGVRVSVDDEDAVSSDVDDRFRSLSQRLQAAFKDSPLVLTNDAASERPGLAADVNGAMLQSQNAINRVAGALKMSAAFQPLSHLNVTAAPDAAFSAELHDIQFLVDTLSSSAADTLSSAADTLSSSAAPLKPFIEDATPDSFLFHFRALTGVISAYGADSPQVQEAKAIVEKIIGSSMEAVEKIYSQRVAVEVLTLPNRANDDAGSSFVAGSFMNAAAGSRPRRAVDAGANPHNIAKPYDWKYAAQFNMCIWTGVILVIVVYLIAYGMWNMDPGRDGYVYRMTMPKKRNA